MQMISDTEMKIYIKAPDARMVNFLPQKRLLRQLQPDLSVITP
jgi:hypothetical protein